MNQDLIKEVALEGAEKFGVVADDSEIVDLVTWCVAELSKRAEAVAKVQKHTGSLKDMAIIVWTNEQPPEGTKLFTFPPIHDIEALTDSYVQQVPDKCDRIVWRNNYYHLPLDIEAIENRVAEACAKVYLETYDLTDIADDVRSGAWRKHK